MCPQTFVCQYTVNMSITKFVLNNVLRFHNPFNRLFFPYVVRNNIRKKDISKSVGVVGWCEGAG